MRKAGIDPGAEGGLAYIDPFTYHAEPLPYKNNVVDVSLLTEFLVAYDPDVLVLERQLSVARQGHQKIIMINYGRILACAELLGIQVKEISAIAWQKKVLPRKQRTYTERVHAYTDKAVEHFPDVDFCPGRRTTPHDGMAAALWITDSL